MLRCADAAGADAVVLTDASVDLYNPKSVRASVGSLFHLPVAVGVPVEQAVEGLRAAGVRILAADGAGEDDLDAELDAGTMGGPSAWVFGNEAWGLPEETRALADAVVRVPIHGKAESLNLATAAAVCLYASARAQRAPGGCRSVTPASNVAARGPTALLGDVGYGDMSVGTNSTPAAAEAAGPPPPAVPARAARGVPTQATPARAADRQPPVSEFAGLGIDPDDLPDGLVVADHTGRVICFNSAAARITALPAGEAIGARIDRALPLEDLEGRRWWALTDPYGGLATRRGQPERNLLLPGGARSWSPRATCAPTPPAR